MDGLEGLLDEGEREMVREAANARAESLEAFLRDAVLERVADTIGEEGHLECWVEGCAETFTSERRRRGHVGRVHSDNLPEGEFWCGICGYGPTSYPGVAAHHGHHHTGEDVRPLSHEPDVDELLDPDDVPDHMDPDLLARLYEEHDGNIQAMCREYDFEVTYGRVRQYLIDFDIHESTPKGEGAGPDHRDRELLEDLYERHGGNISELYRAHDFEVGYTEVVKQLRRMGIHDSTDPPGKRHGKGGTPSSTSEETCIGAMETAAEKLGHPPTVREYDALELTPPSHTIVRRLGSWTDAKEAAGLDTGRSTDYSREDCLEAVRAVAEEIERAPSTGDYQRHRRESHPSYQTIYTRFGSFPDFRAEALEGTLWEEESDEAAEEPAPAPEPDPEPVEEPTPAEEPPAPETDDRRPDVDLEALGIDPEDLSTTEEQQQDITKRMIEDEA